MRAARVPLAQRAGCTAVGCAARCGALSAAPPLAARSVRGPLPSAGHLGASTSSRWAAFCMHGLADPPVRFSRCASSVPCSDTVRCPTWTGKLGAVRGSTASAHRVRSRSIAAAARHAAPRAKRHPLGMQASATNRAVRTTRCFLAPISCRNGRACESSYRPIDPSCWPYLSRLHARGAPS